MLPLYSIIFKSKKIAKQLSFKVAKHQRSNTEQTENKERKLRVRINVDYPPSSDEAHVTENSFFFLVFVKKAKRSVHI